MSMVYLEIVRRSATTWQLCVMTTMSCDHLWGHSIGRHESWIFSSADFCIVKLGFYSRIGDFFESSYLCCLWTDPGRIFFEMSSELSILEDFQGVFGFFLGCPWVLEKFFENSRFCLFFLVGYFSRFQGWTSPAGMGGLRPPIQNSSS